MKVEEERKKEIIAKLTDDQKATIKKWAEKAEKDVKEVFADFCGLYDNEAVEGIDEEMRIEWAMNVTYARILEEAGRPLEKFEIYVVGLDEASNSTKRAGSIHGIGSVPGSKEAVFITVKAWRDEKKMLKGLESTKSYMMTGTRQSPISNKVTYNLEATSTIEETDFFKVTDKKKIETMLRGFFPKIEVKNAETNASRDGDYTDFKLIKGIVTGQLTKTRDDGSLLCMYFVVDDSVPMPSHDGGDNPRSAMTVFVTPKMMKFGAWSELLIIGRINAPRNEYGASVNAVGIIPIVSTPTDVNPSTVEESTIEVSDGEDGVVSEDEIDEEDLDGLL